MSALEDIHLKGTVITILRTDTALHKGLRHESALSVRLARTEPELRRRGAKAGRVVA